MVDQSLMNKKTIASLALTSALALLASMAQAAPPTADLQVSGKLVVPVCSVAAADDGVYNIGKQSATVVKPAADTVLGDMTKTWTIACDAETYLNFSVVDNRADTASTVSAINYGLGSVNGTGKIGFYTARIGNAKVDNVDTLLHGTSGTTVTTAGKEIGIYKTYKTIWVANASTQKSGKVFMADITVTPTLASSAVMNGPITEDTNIDGSMTLTFAYGL